MPCYSGNNPIGKLTDAQRLSMWKWVKENAIDHGMPFEQVHDILNNHYFGGSAKPEWINEFLAARKTPLKANANAAWAAQARRRNIQNQAKHLVNDRNASFLERGAKAVIAGPRYVAVGGGVHGVVFPFSHAGALTLNPARWGDFARLVRNTWRNLSPAEAENLRDTMARAPRFTMAGRLGLDFSTHGAETGGGNVSARTWGALVESRFRLWDAAMERHTRAGMSAEDMDSIGRELAVWANHATGSGKGIFADPRISWAPFGPKLMQSYWNRLIGDPIHTVNTFAKWAAGNATAGEKVVAMQRLRGAMTLATTYSGMLAANQAFLAATGQKDKINWTDMTQSDWLAFKWGGFRWGIPGAMHSEIKLIGQILAAQVMKPDDLAKTGIIVPHGTVDPGRLMSLRELYVARQLFDYAKNKATPLIGLEEELRTGHNWEGHPLPWVSGKEKKPALSWGEYGWSKAPIPLSAAAGYVYDELRNNGASVTDASMWMRAVMVGALSATTAVELKAVKDSTPHRTRYQATVGH